ncbi:hypothetical protein [Paramicrobacterium chengjingii]|uniref:Uncharacterized protein n=1 Tax=Paramicrobacterium chengjingii TaxID=2769067 RepID=A0ABX6YE83_9MICO|nr:hypothetical protein [Microbacterium chengjingii]QPZ37023.1 hypothetical protein HCR76_09010 [Microbacterium chengjingii]
MTSFSDEQPLSRRQRRERQRAQQAHDSVLQSKSAPEGEASEAPAEPDSAEKAKDSPPAPIPSAAAKERVDSQEQDRQGESESAHDDRPLTRRELRALRAETGMTAVVSPSEDADADNERTPAAKAATSTASNEEQTSQKPKGSKLGFGRKKADAKNKKNSSTEAQKPGSDSSAPTDAKKSDPATEPADDEPKVSSAFGAGERNKESSPQGAAKAFDTLVAPEARGSDVFTTSSVLILPGAQSRQTRTPAPGTGEIMVTGSVDLPKSKARDRESNADHSEIDSGSDNSQESPATAGTPVSATRAVSTHAVTRDVITPPTKASSSKLLMILAITAGVLCVAVIGVVIAGLMTGQF